MENNIQKQNYELWQQRAIELDYIRDTFDDVYKRDLENKLIYDNIPICYNLLDVGCGSGYGTVLYAAKAKYAVGIDYSENMIEKAKNTYKTSNVQFFHLNILDINNKRTELDGQKFDVIVSQRSLINIMDRKQQFLAIKNIHSLLNPDGLFLMLEAPEQSRHEINRVRILYGLEPLPELKFNLNFDEEELQNYLSEMFIIENKIYTGYYDFISKVVYPLACYPQEPKFKSSVNKLSYDMMIENPELHSVFKQYSRCFLYIMRLKK